MTRKSKCELEWMVENLDSVDYSDSIAVVYEDPRPGEWYASHAREELVDPDADTVFVIEDVVVMRRKKAEGKRS